jgi:hypothetical protein
MTGGFGISLGKVEVPDESLNFAFRKREKKRERL